MSVTKVKARESGEQHMRKPCGRKKQVSQRSESQSAESYKLYESQNRKGWKQNVRRGWVLNIKSFVGHFRILVLS